MQIYDTKPFWMIRICWHRRGSFPCALFKQAFLNFTFCRAQYWDKLLLKWQIIKDTVSGASLKRRYTRLKTRSLSVVDTELSVNSSKMTVLQRPYRWSQFWTFPSYYKYTASAAFGFSNMLRIRPKGGLRIAWKASMLPATRARNSNRLHFHQTPRHYAAGVVRFSIREMSKHLIKVGPLEIYTSRILTCAFF